VFGGAAHELRIVFATCARNPVAEFKLSFFKRQLGGVVAPRWVFSAPIKKISLNVRSLASLHGERSIEIARFGTRILTAGRACFFQQILSHPFIASIFDKQLTRPTV
jgi:hypothetical protein